MRVIIIGCSRVGEAITRIMCDEGHDVVVIDSDAEKIEKITKKLYFNINFQIFENKLIR